MLCLRQCVYVKWIKTTTYVGQDGILEKILAYKREKQDKRGKRDKIIMEFVRTYTFIFKTICKYKNKLCEKISTEAATGGVL